jgi:hypothetical protein
MGPLRIVGPVPGTHEFRAKSFVYESDLSDDDRWSASMARRMTVAPSRRIKSDDLDTLARVLEEAEAGAKISIVPPGLDTAGNVLLADG